MVTPPKNKGLPAPDGERRTRVLPAVLSCLFPPLGQNGLRQTQVQRPSDLDVLRIPGGEIDLLAQPLHSGAVVRQESPRRWQYASGRSPIAAEHQNRIVRSRRMSPFPTVATSKTPGMEICKARPSGRFAWPLHISISDDKFPAGRENLHRKITLLLTNKIGNRISCKIAPAVPRAP